MGLVQLCHISPPGGHQRFQDIMIITPQNELYRREGQNLVSLGIKGTKTAGDTCLVTNCPGSHSVLEQRSRITWMSEMGGRKIQVIAKAIRARKTLISSNPPDDTEFQLTYEEGFWISLQCAHANSPVCLLGAKNNPK